MHGSVNELPAIETCGFSNSIEVHRSAGSAALGVSTSFEMGMNRMLHGRLDLGWYLQRIK